MNDLIPDRNDRLVATWLFLCAALIFAMILLGGITRLTHSGLSMVEWRPLMGAVPPLGESAWLEAFDKYKQYPEYWKINPGMGLDEFKFIFLFEYAHRLLGRLIGISFLLPLIYFLAKGTIHPGFKPKLIIIFFLGGLQGLLGWHMVKSGLIDNPHVSQYRLTAHLGAAVLIYGYILWVGFELMFPADGNRFKATRPRLRRYASVLVFLLFLMILSGGLVAGTRAGLAYGTFPLMGDAFFPDNLYGTTPFWMAPFEDITTIQFNHRMFAYLLIILILGFAAWAIRRPLDGRSRTTVSVLVTILLVQVLLGIMTLLLMVPTTLAVLHQGGAIVLFSTMLFIRHSLGADSGRGELSHRPCQTESPALPG